MEIKVGFETAKQQRTFNDIYQEYYHQCFLFAKSYTHLSTIAQDIASEAMIALWKAMKEEHIANIQAYLMTSIKNRSLDYLRHERMKIEAHENLLYAEQYELEFRITTLESCNPETLFSEEVQTILEQTLQSLPTQTRKVFEMSRFENKSIKEIAAILNISIKGVDYHIAKALKVLRVNLKDYLSIFFFLLNYFFCKVH